MLDTPIDKLTVEIDAKANDANSAIDSLCKKIDILTTAIGSLNGVNINKFTKSISSIGNLFNSFQGLNGSFKNTIKSTDDFVSEITERYKDLGKGFELKGNITDIQKEIDKLSNSLSKVDMKKEEFMLSGASGGKMFEYSIRDAIKYSNQIESLEKQLQSFREVSSNSNYKINLFGKGEDIGLNDFEEQLKYFKDIISAGGTETDSGIVFPTRGLEISLEQLRSLYPDAKVLISSYEAEIENLKKITNNMPQMGDVLVPIDGFMESFENKIPKASEKLKELGNLLKKLEVPEVREENLDKLNASIEKTKIKLEELRIKLANGLTMGTITESIDDSGYVRLQEQITLTEKKLDALKNKKAEVEKQSAFDKLKESLSKISGAFSKVVSGISKFGNGIKNAFLKVKNFRNSLHNIGKSAKAMNVSLSGGIKTVLKYAFSVGTIFAAFNKLKSAIKDGMKNLAQYSSKTNSSISSLKNSLTQLKNASASMAAPLLNTFAPALNQIIQICIKATNAVNQLFSALTGNSTWIKAKNLTDDYAESLDNASSAANNSARSFDELNIISTSNNSGGSSGTNASDMFETVTVESQFQEFAEKIKQMWKNADFTELGTIVGSKIKNALDGIDFESIQQSASKIGTSIGTFINGAIEVDGFGYSIGETIGNAFNTGISLSTSFFDSTRWDSVGVFIGDGLNGAVNSVRWDDYGHLFASKVNALFEVVGNTSITFDWANLGTSLSDSLNTFINDFSWEENAIDLATLVNGLVTAVSNFLKDTEWKDLGTGITSGISSFFGEIKWEEIGGGISYFAIGIFDFLAGLIDGIEWEDVPQAIIDGVSDFFNGIDWDETFGSVGELIGTAVAAGIDLIKGIADILGDIGTKVKNYFVKKFEEAGYDDDKDLKENGKAILNGLLNGILEVINNIGEWIKKHVFNPIVEGVKKAFGIHSPAKEMKPLGKNIILGLIDGFTQTSSDLKEKLGEIKGKIVENFKEAKEKASEKINELKENVGGKFESIRSSISEKTEFAKNAVSNKFESIRSTVASKSENLSSKVSSAFEDVRKNISEKLEKAKISSDSFKSTVNTLTTKLSDLFGFNNKKLSFNLPTDLLKNFSNSVSSVVDKIKNLFSFSGKTVKINSSVSSYSAAGKSVPVKGYATGGFPRKSSLFYAGEGGRAELLGTVGGKTAVAGGAEITGIREEIRSTSNEEIALLKQQNNLLQAILQKEFGITQNEIGKAARNYAKDYSKRTGREAYSFS